MIIFIHFCFFFIWVMYDGLIATPITLFIPFSFKIQELVKNKKYLLSTLISLVPFGIYSSSNISSYDLYTAILILILALIPMFFITYIILYILGFLDYYLRTKGISNNIISGIFYLLYLIYMTIIYFSSNHIVTVISNFLSKII